MADKDLAVIYQRGNQIFLNAQYANANGDWNWTWQVPEYLGPLVISGIQINCPSNTTLMSNPENTCVVINALTPTSQGLWWRQTSNFALYGADRISCFVAINRAVPAHTIFQTFAKEVDTAGSPTGDINMYVEAIILR